MFNTLLSNPKIFRYAFVLFLLFSAALNGVILQNHSNFYILYVFSAIFLGIGFYNQSIWFLIFFDVLIVLGRFFLIPEITSGFFTFLVYFLTYTIIIFITVGLMKNLQKVKQDHIELTTALAKALDSRDPYTMHHSENVAKYSVEIAKKLKLSKELCNIIRIGGLLHDIGKIGIPEHILNKPDKLTDEEYQIIKTHPQLGYEMIKHIASFNDNGVLDIVLYHHERYDGKGYPKGLAGNEIPLVARIAAVADTFDAMTSRRIYRNGANVENALNEIRQNKGTQFDPEIVDSFLNLFE